MSQKLRSYLDRCITKSKIEFKDDDTIFKQWNQYMINTFYFYCKEQYVLPITFENNNQIIELYGLPNLIDGVKEKYRVLDTLQKQKLRIQTTIRPSSAARRRSATTTTTNIICYNIILIYCSKDEARCQRLANRLTDDNFSVLMVNITTASIQIDKCDCIIICLSQYLEENDETMKNIINESSTKVILVKFQYLNTSVSDWLHDFMIGKLCYNLYGSDNYFNLEYDKLMLEVLKITKPGYVSLLQPTVDRTNELQQLKRQIEEQRRHVYDKRVKKLSELGKISDDDMMNSIGIVQTLINEEEAKSNERIQEKESNEYMTKEIKNTIQFDLDTFLLIYRRWLSKAPNIIKQNIPPFTLTGDINDAVFPTPDDMSKNPKEFIRKYFLKYKPFSFGSYGYRLNQIDSTLESIFSVYGKIPVKRLDLVDRTFGVPSEQMLQFNECLFSKRKRFPFDTILPDNPWKGVNFIGSSTKTEKEMEKRKQLDDNYFIMKEFRDMKTKKYVDKYPSKHNQISECFEKFIQQKNKNTMEFDMLCKNFSV